MFTSFHSHRSWLSVYLICTNVQQRIVCLSDDKPRPCGPDVRHRPRSSFLQPTGSSCPALMQVRTRHIATFLALALASLRPERLRGPSTRSSQPGPATSSSGGLTTDAPPRRGAAMRSDAAAADAAAAPPAPATPQTHATQYHEGAGKRQRCFEARCAAARCWSTDSPHAEAAANVVRMPLEDWLRRPASAESGSILGTGQTNLAQSMNTTVLRPLRMTRSSR